LQLSAHPAETLGGSPLALNRWPGRQQAHRMDGADICNYAMIDFVHCCFEKPSVATNSSYPQGDTETPNVGQDS